MIMRRFIRRHGELLQIEPLTKPHRHRSLVTVQIVRTGEITLTENRDIIVDY